MLNKQGKPSRYNKKPTALATKYHTTIYKAVRDTGYQEHAVFKADQLIISPLIYRP